MDVIQLPITALYAGLQALLLVPLSFNVVRNRLRAKVPLLDGGDEQLRRAIRVQGNFIEYVPVALVLMMLVELNGAPHWAIHIFGLVLFVGRLFHAYGLGRESGPSFGRLVGTNASWAVIVVAGALAIYQYIAAQMQLV